MTTTPDNHQTPEQAYDRWRNHRINRELAGAIGDYAAADGHAEHELAAAIAFVRSCLPSALPSPASDRCTCDKFERGHDEHEPWCGGPAPSAPPPASEAEQPKCTHGQEDCEACHGEGSINCPHGCEPRRSAPTAPTSAGAGSATTWEVTIECTKRNQQGDVVEIATATLVHSCQPNPGNCA